MNPENKIAMKDVLGGIKTAAVLAVIVGVGYFGILDAVRLSPECKGVLPDCSPKIPQYVDKIRGELSRLVTIPQVEKKANSSSFSWQETSFSSPRRELSFEELFANS